jgi:hypothetical protein
MAITTIIKEELPKKLINLNLLVTRSSWVAWWVQIILTVISFVILSFANAVRNGANAQVITSGFFLSAVGVCVSFINCFTTWNFTRLSRRVVQGKIPSHSINDIFRKYAQISVGISLIGMLVTLIGAEQIVGNLASKILSSQSIFSPYSPGAIPPTSSLQALDIFLVQANTNTLLSHFAPLSIYIWLQTQFAHDTKTVIEPPKNTTVNKNIQDNFLG